MSRSVASIQPSLLDDGTVGQPVVVQVFGTAELLADLFGEPGLAGLAGPNDEDNLFHEVFEDDVFLSAQHATILQ